MGQPSGPDPRHPLRQLRVRLLLGFGAVICLALASAAVGWLDWMTLAGLDADVLRLSLLVGLGGSVFVLVVELLIKVREVAAIGTQMRHELAKIYTDSHETLHQSIQQALLAARGQALNEPDRNFVEAVCRDLARVRRSGHHFFRQHLDEIQSEFAARLRDLAEDKIEVDPRHHKVAISTYRLSSLSQCRELRGVQCRSPEDWLTPDSQVYISNQREARERGWLTVAKRVFILAEEDRPVARDVLQMHIDAAIEVRVASFEDLSADDTLLREYTIIKENEAGAGMIIYPVKGLAHGRRAERLDARPREIVDRLRAFELLWERSGTVDEYLRG